MVARAELTPGRGGGGAALLLLLSLLSPLAGCGAHRRAVAAESAARQEAALQAELRGPPARARYFVLLAVWKEQSGDLAGAAAALRSALLHDPGSIWLQQRLIALEQPAPQAPQEPG